MRQAWHIFRKDVLHLRAEAAIYIGVIAAACILPNVYNLCEWLVMLTSAYLIARVVQSDALAGDGQFWITRPYRRTSLFVAKLLFIVLLVDLPIFAAQTILLLRSHFSLASVFGGLLWEQFLWLAGESLPLAALAALTSGLIPFICSAILVGLMSAGISMLVSLPQHSLHESEWVRSSIGLVIALAASAAALYFQYRWRDTRRSAPTVLSIASLGIAAYVFVPWPLAFAVQERLSSGSVDLSALRITVDTNREKWAIAMSREERVQIAAPVLVGGFPAGIEARAEAIDLTFQGVDGRSANAIVSDLVQREGVFAAVNAGLDRGFFESERDRAVTLRGSLYLTIFGNRTVYTIPAPVIERQFLLTDRLRCAALGNAVSCNAPWRWPNQLIHVYQANTSYRLPLSYGMSYSPFPAQLTFFPMENRFGPPLITGAQDAVPRAHARDLTIEVLDPITYVRRDFVIRDVHLTDIALPWRSERVYRNGKMSFENEY